jgi:hypothetical protein
MKTPECASQYPSFLNTCLENCKKASKIYAQLKLQNYIQFNDALIKIIDLEINTNTVPVQPSHPLET